MQSGHAFYCLKMACKNFLQEKKREKSVGGKEEGYMILKDGFQQMSCCHLELKLDNQSQIFLAAAVRTWHLYSILLIEFVWFVGHQLKPLVIAEVVFFDPASCLYFLHEHHVKHYAKKG